MAFLPEVPISADDICGEYWSHRKLKRMLHNGLEALGSHVLIAAILFGAPLLLLWCPAFTLLLGFLAIIAVGIAPNEDYWDYETDPGIPSSQ